MYGDVSVVRRSYALLLRAQDDPVELRERLASHGWDAVVASDPGALVEDPRFTQCAVGIAVFNDEHAVDPGRLSAAIVESRMEWLALTTAGVAALPQFGCLLANAFFDFHTLPLDPQRIVQALGHAYGKSMLRRRLRESTMPIRGRYGMVGTSPAMLDMYRLLDKFVRVDAPVLLNGESGTGKELAALAVHRESARSGGPFVPVNCGAIPATLIQSQLFGHEKGAFTGAHQRQIGSLEAANGGTIFLDEIGDLPLESQASLLRFLQESTIVRVGSTKTIAIDARVVAATHVDLGAAVRAGRFREDLYYRLNVLHLDIPPLRARLEDLPLLVEHVLEV
ncbi:MAG TPA: sigma-54 dependent transcriptional regulator, partial [Burkholderiaceae bacterium]|nr:sigma-54 dependent transcriptional regulator [Burkholderiaceae bacterium]